MTRWLFSHKITFNSRWYQSIIFHFILYSGIYSGPWTELIRQLCRTVRWWWPRTFQKIVCVDIEFNSSLIQCCNYILTNISIFVECIWMIWESSVIIFGHTWPRPYVECTCSLFSNKHSFGDWIQILKNGSIHLLHGLIVAQSKPDNFIAVFLCKVNKRKSWKSELRERNGNGNGNGVVPWW